MAACVLQIAEPFESQLTRQKMLVVLMANMETDFKLFSQQHAEI